MDIAAAQVVRLGKAGESRAREAIIEVRQGTRPKPRNDDDITNNTVLTGAIDTAINALKLIGWEKMGYTEWTEDEQLASRPVMFPWELVDVDATTTVVIVPGRYNLHLKRFRYFSDPVMSAWARRDPNKPAFVAQEPKPVAPAPMQPPAYVPPPAPVYQPAASATSTVGAVAGELGSAVGGWLQKKMQDKLAGK